MADGAELVTVFGRLHNPASGSQDLDVPLLAVLRDSLGDSDPGERSPALRLDPDQHPAHALAARRLRALVRVFPRRKQAPRQSSAVARARIWPRPPRSVYGNLFSDGLQALELDPLGAAVRSTTRTYRGNSSDYSKLQVFQALATLDNLERDPEASSSSARQPVPRDLLPPQPLHTRLRRPGSRAAIVEILRQADQPAASRLAATIGSCFASAPN